MVKGPPTTNKAVDCNNNFILCVWEAEASLETVQFRDWSEVNSRFVACHVILHFQ